MFIDIVRIPAISTFPPKAIHATVETMMDVLAEIGMVLEIESITMLKRMTNFSL